MRYYTTRLVPFSRVIAKTLKKPLPDFDPERTFAALRRAYLRHRATHTLDELQKFVANDELAKE